MIIFAPQTDCGMESISMKIDAIGGTISTADLSDSAEYMRVRRAVQRGELTKLRSGGYASPRSAA